jgi:hypothetical protein
LCAERRSNRYIAIWAKKRTEFLAVLRFCGKAQRKKRGDVELRGERFYA